MPNMNPETNGALMAEFHRHRLALIEAKKRSVDVVEIRQKVRELEAQLVERFGKHQFKARYRKEYPADI